MQKLTLIFILLAIVSSRASSNGTERGGFPDWNVERLFCRVTVVEFRDGKPEIGFYRIETSRMVGGKVWQLPDSLIRFDHNANTDTTLKATVSFARADDPVVAQERSRTYQLEEAPITMPTPKWLEGLSQPRSTIIERVQEATAVVKVVPEGWTFGNDRNGDPQEEVYLPASCTVHVRELMFGADFKQHDARVKQLRDVVANDVWTEASMFTLALHNAVASTYGDTGETPDEAGARIKRLKKMIEKKLAGIQALKENIPGDEESNWLIELETYEKLYIRSLNACAEFIDR